ncbi:putative undecaprenyl-phosphate N-acetylglucosaminyl 1-phosphate transferase [bioreactor metagenome]|jgi:UDP-GlcNAc:undecaprenyl-phosphate GlcNAc-1-phosphate transferase|uniref:Putative undecaprenyl-phosphate N-acetylglucosaminyl 1-phosphate transferase n=1 Tax=bioreactor metagenome TaxID=1076179 RepID=A0A644YBT9_9ZZZZ
MWWSFLSSFLVANLITPIIISWYRRHHWLDDPETHQLRKNTHQKAVPRGGGLVIFFATLLPALFILQIDSYLIAIFFGAFLLTLVGFLDDLFDLSPYLRMFTGLAAALIVVGSGIGIAYVSNPFGGGVLHLDQPQIHFSLFGQDHSIWVLSSLFAVFFLLWNMNIINWAKGVDGQLPGFVAISCVFIALLAGQFHDAPTQFNVAHLSLIVAGAFAGFLLWNFYPQKIMPGYGAGSLAGYFLSVLAILSGAKVATTLMVLAVPMADGIFTITRRILAGKSPFWGDRGHLHHKLMDSYGWGRRRIALFYMFCSAFMGVLSLFLDTRGKILAIILVTLFVFSFLIYSKIKQHDES